MKTKIAFLALLSVVLISACKKEGEGNSSNRLQGRWEVEKKIEVVYRNDVEESRDTLLFDPNEYIYEFRNDDSLLLHSNGTTDDERYKYGIYGSELVIRSGSDGYFFQLKWFTTNRMSFIADQTHVNSSGVRTRYTDETICNRLP